MSTYGGDSWAPEAASRRKRLEGLALEGAPREEVQKLSNGKFVCLVCPKRPVVDTAAMLMVHRSGFQHLAAANVKRELHLQHVEEVNKRTALGLPGRISTTEAVPCHSMPLLAETRKRTVCVLRPKETDGMSLVSMGKSSGNGGSPDSNSLVGSPFFFNSARASNIGAMRTSRSVNEPAEHPKRQSEEWHRYDQGTPRPYVSKRARLLQLAGSEPSSEAGQKPRDSNVNLFSTERGESNRDEASIEGGEHAMRYGKIKDSNTCMRQCNKSCCTEKQRHEGLRQPMVCKMEEIRASQGRQYDRVVQEEKDSREKELKLRESGWRRDGYGSWFREADVEFDSDEETPHKFGFPVRE